MESIEKEEKEYPRHKFKPRGWSNGAKACYKRGCVCKSDCDNFRHCYAKYIQKGLIPRMKDSVLELVRKCGRPQGIVTQQIKEGNR